MAAQTKGAHAPKAQSPPANSDAAWIEAEALREDAAPTREEAAAAALDEMRRDRTAHLTSTLLRRLSEGSGMEEIAGAIIPHLGICAWCHSMLRDTLKLADAPGDSLAYAILEDAEEWARWDAAGRTAAEEACRALTEQGIDYAYGRSGAVYARQPDGRETLLHEAETSAS